MTGRAAAGRRQPGRRWRAQPCTVREVLAGMRLVADSGRVAGFDRWTELLPAALRGHVRPLRWERKTLWLEVDGPVWAQETRMLAPGLLLKLNAACGSVVVTEIKTKVVPPRTTGRA